MALVAEMTTVAELLDRANQTNEHRAALDSMSERLEDRLTPAAMLLNEMQQNNETYYRMAMRKAVEHREYFRSQQLSPEVIEKYRQMAAQSLSEQNKLRLQILSPLMIFSPPITIATVW